TSGIVGDIGTDGGGTISGFGTSTHIGDFHNADAVTAQAVIDLNIAYTALMALPNTVTGHTPTFGSGETINAGVYHIAAAGSLAGTITLDGQNDPDAIFVFKFAGAFSAAAQSRVILANGTKRCNVFWISGAGVATGAFSLGTFSYMRGTVISHGGACTAGANGRIEGRMLSTGGAIGLSAGVAYNDCTGNTDCTDCADTHCIPEANPTMLTTCDNSNGAGSGVFFLDDANPIVTTTSGVAISYHPSLLDAQNNTNILISPYTSSDGTVYVKVERISTGCFATSEITLGVGAKCDENCNNGIDDDGDGLIDGDDQDCCRVYAPTLKKLMPLP
ncbi:MAG: hypothetical protein ACI9VN_003344, partial [Patescibacteria group bacterium]